MTGLRLDAVAALRHCGRVALAIGAAALVGGCAPAPGGAGLASNGARAGLPGPMTSRFAAGGVSAPEAGIRHYLANRDSTALRAIAGLPGDTVLRLLHWGMAHHRLGHWEASNRSFQIAEQMSEDRFTKSVRQGLGAALINDKTLDYVPPPHERAFMHYYGMLNYLELGDRDAAMVEARKANAFLERYTRENGHRTYAADALVQYMAGMLQVARGEAGEAIVSLRKAGEAYDVYRTRYGVPSPKFVGVDIVRTASEVGINEVATDVSTRYGLTKADLASTPGTGDVLVLIENGYIAHRVQQKLYVPILASEAALLKDGGALAATTVGLVIVDRTLTLFTETNRGNEYAQAYEQGYILGAMIGGGEVFSMAWPKYMLHANSAAEVVVQVGTSRQEALVMNDLSAIAARHFEEEKDQILRRAMFRAAGKYALVKFAEKKAEDAAERAGGGWKGEIASRTAKAAAQGLANASEQADTRSWSSLPAELRAARFTLPAGEHDVMISITDADGTIRKIDLGRVTVQAKGLTVRSAFVDGTSRGATQRFAMAARGTDLQASDAVATGAMSAATVAPAGSPANAVGAGAGAAAGAGAILSGAASAATPSGNSRMPTPAASAPTTPPPPPPPATAATIAAIRPVATAFKPLSGETARFELLMRSTPAAERRERASLDLYTVPQGSADTIAVWSGTEGDTAFWDGTIRGEPARAGQYTWIVRANTPRASAPTQYAWMSQIQVEAPQGSSLLPLPDRPTLEPETRSVMRPDYGKKRKRFRTGLVLTAIGAGVSTAGYSMATSAIASTSPGSAERQMAFNTWAGGIAVASIGAIVASRGWFKNYERAVDEPDGGAIQRNQEARDAHARALAEVDEKNNQVKESVVIRLGNAGATRSRTGGRP